MKPKNIKYTFLPFGFLMFFQKENKGQAINRADMYAVVNQKKKKMQFNFSRTLRDSCRPLVPLNLRQEVHCFGSYSILNREKVMWFHLEKNLSMWTPD